MHVDEITELFEDARVRPGARVEFSTLGFCDYATEDLLTVAEDETELAIALENPYVAVLLTSPALAPRDAGDRTVVVCPEPARVFMTLHNHLATETEFYGVHEPSTIHPDARVHPQAYVDPYGVTLEEGGTVEPFACIYAGAHLEAGVTVRAGAVIGEDAIQRRRFDDGEIQLVHRGGVRVGRGAHIGTHVVVGAGIFHAPTYIGEEAYLSPHALVGHEVAVGHRCRLLPGAILLGSCEIGDDAWIMPGAIVMNGVTVGEGAKVSPGSFATRDVAPGARVTGYFAVEHARFLGAFRRLHGAPSEETVVARVG